MNPQLLIILILALSPGGNKISLSQLKNIPPMHPPRFPTPPPLRFSTPSPLRFSTPPPLRLPKGPAYIDTFKMELALDRMRSITDALNKINSLNYAQKVPGPKGKLPSVDRIKDSLDAVRGFLAEGKQSEQIDTISNTLSGVKKLGDMDELISAMGPILSMIKNSDQK